MYTWYTWDFTQKAVLDLFVAQCTNLTSSGLADGCFVDGCLNIPMPLDT